VLCTGGEAQLRSHREQQVTPRSRAEIAFFRLTMTYLVFYKGSLMVSHGKYGVAGVDTDIEDIENMVK
jgi:hypothetical protein